MSAIPVILKPKPGVKRDGTTFEGDACVDARWARWQRELPRKIAGYRRLSNEMEGIVRPIHTQAFDTNIYVHVGHANGVQRFTMDENGLLTVPVDRTPTTFTANENYTWMFDAMQDGVSGEMKIIAHPQTTLANISDATMNKAYIGNIYSSAALTEIPTDGVGGGIVVLHPYLFMYCSNGYIKWSDANDPENFSSGDAGDGYIASSKVVKGLPLRGGGQSPAGLFWTLDSVIRCTYVGGAAIFQFDTISAASSVLAVNGIIEYDGIFYWAGIDRFLMYNGVVREVPNDMNLNYFYDGLNWDERNKIFAFKIPRYGEIWWCYPRGDATECTHAVIYNVRENTWYDTELPNNGRSAGIYAQVFKTPLLTGSEAIPTDPGSLRITEAGDSRITEDGYFRVTDTGLTYYKFWCHEYGVDEIDGISVNAVQSYFETSDISMLLTDPPKSRGLLCEMMEPDFVQTGDMQVRIVGRINARAPEVEGPVKTFPDSATEGYEQPVFFKEQRREMRFRFESNIVGGDYQMGQVIVHVGPGDGRYQS